MPTILRIDCLAVLTLPAELLGLGRLGGGAHGPRHPSPSVHQLRFPELGPTARRLVRVCRCSRRIRSQPKRSRGCPLHNKTERLVSTQTITLRLPCFHSSLCSGASPRPPLQPPIRLDGPLADALIAARRPCRPPTTQPNNWPWRCTSTSRSSGAMARPQPLPPTGQHASTSICRTCRVQPRHARPDRRAAVGTLPALLAQHRPFRPSPADPHRTRSRPRSPTF